MKELHETIKDPENKRLYQLTQSHVTAYEIDLLKIAWSTQGKINLKNPIGFALNKEHVYLADQQGIYKINSIDGNIEERESLQGFYAKNGACMEIMNDRIVLLGANKAIATYDLEHLNQIDKLSSGRR